MGLKEMANRFVRAKEQIDLEMMADRAIESAHRAEGCGCFQCQKAATSDQERFANENWRVNVRTPDQEEKEIMNWAIKNRLLKSSDD